MSVCVCLFACHCTLCVCEFVLNVVCVLMFVLCITYIYEHLSMYVCVSTWLSVCLCLKRARGDGMTLFNLQHTSSSRNL